MPIREGEDHPRARLTAARVAELRRRARSGESFAALVAEAGLAWSTLHRALTGQAWKSVDAVEPPVPLRRRRWTAQELAALAEQAGAPARAVAQRLGRSRAAIDIARSRRRRGAPRETTQETTQPRA